MLTLLIYGPHLEEQAFKYYLFPKQAQLWDPERFALVDENEETRWEPPFPVNFRDICHSLTSLSSFVSLSLKQDEMMAGLEGVFKGRVSSWVSLAPPTEPHRPLGRISKATWVERFFVIFFFFQVRNCVRAGSNARVPPGTIQQWPQQELGPVAEPAPHYVFMGPHSHLQHPLHVSLPSRSPSVSPNLALSLPFPRSLPCHLYAASSRHLHVQLWNVQKPALMLITATTPLPRTAFLEPYLSHWILATTLGE